MIGNLDLLGLVVVNMQQEEGQGGHASLSLPSSLMWLNIDNSSYSSKQKKKERGRGGGFGRLQHHH